MGNIKYPFGPADEQTPAAAANIELTITNQKTIVDCGVLAAAMEIDLAIDAEVKAGAELIIKAKSDGTARDITLGEGFLGPVIAGVINKTKVAKFEYDGTNFVQVAAALQVD